LLTSDRLTGSYFSGNDGDDALTSKAKISGLNSPAPGDDQPG
jgi:hypothetical protein